MQGTLEYLAAGSSRTILTPSLVAALAGPAALPKARKSKISRRKTKDELEVLEKLYAHVRSDARRCRVLRA